MSTHVNTLLLSSPIETLTFSLLLLCSPISVPYIPLPHPMYNCTPHPSHVVLLLLPTSPGELQLPACSGPHKCCPLLLVSPHQWEASSGMRGPIGEVLGWAERIYKGSYEGMGESFASLVVRLGYLSSLPSEGVGG